MSEENVEVVRRLLEAGDKAFDAYRKNPESTWVEAYDAGELDPDAAAVLALLDPEVEFSSFASMLEGGSNRGHREWLRLWEMLLNQTDEIRFRDTGVRKLQADRVFAPVELTIRWKGSGMRLSEQLFSIFSLREGLITRLSLYTDREVALEAAGLSE